MKRRQLLIALLISAVGGCGQSAFGEGENRMSSGPPENVHLIPDDWHIQHVGRLSDGRLFWVDAQLDPAGGETKDFVCTFVFDQDGRLVENSIELIGVRGTYPNGSVEQALTRHLAALGNPANADIRVRPFSVENSGAVFGLIPRQTEDGEWRVEFMPGNTLSFYAPWEAGEYDT